MQTKNFSQLLLPSLSRAKAFFFKIEVNIFGRHTGLSTRAAGTHVKCAEVILYTFLKMILKM